MIPRLTFYRWGGHDDECDSSVDGRGVELRWLGLYIELNFGRRK
ncbi:hypothetical protein [Sphingomonas changnyeongensis]|nr:hypothetical protein [Sphingomonas changnyeongensis]